MKLEDLRSLIEKNIEDFNKAELHLLLQYIEMIKRLKAFYDKEKL
jgi:hypothetical protein